MFYSQVVNLPTANTVYNLYTLLKLTNPLNAPGSLATAKLKPISTNTGVVAVGNSTMLAVTDGDELSVGDSASQGGQVGIVLETPGTYLIADTDNQKVLVQGHQY